MSKYFMGIDEGTTGCKACLVDAAGTPVAIAAREYPCYYPHPGWVEQDIDEIKNNVFNACKEAIVKSNIDPNDIAGVSHSNQGITMVLLDESDKPVMPRTIGWQDLRYVEILDEIKKNVDLDKFWKLSGMEFGTYNTPSLLWLQKNAPDVWKRVRRICSHQDYFLKQYGADGYFIDEGSANMLGMACADKSEWDDELLKVYGINRSMLPKINHRPGEIVGHVTSEVSLRTGLPVGCNVCQGNLDMNSCTIGAGGDKAGTEVLVMGTARGVYPCLGCLQDGSKSSPHIAKQSRIWELAVHDHDKYRGVCVSLVPRCNLHDGDCDRKDNRR